MSTESENVALAGDPSGWIALGTIAAMIAFIWIYGAPKDKGDQ